ncbi:hypothetical protein [Embleya sp. NPDC005575]|uniref:endonuclease/exonuclease/phosphatase family protein n=1 Tax=Embleya sp. NPDC005575 TaxID=3156892 RepID=UPI0033A734BA
MFPVLIALAAFGLRPAAGSAPVPDPAAGALRVVTYNIRMGFGVDGRFDPDRTANTIRALKPDYPADNPKKEIDQILVDPRLRVAAVDSPPSQASDHLPIAVTLVY